MQCYVTGGPCDTTHGYLSGCVALEALREQVKNSLHSSEHEPGQDTNIRKAVANLVMEYVV